MTVPQPAVAPSHLWWPPSRCPGAQEPRTAMQEEAGLYFLKPDLSGSCPLSLMDSGTFLPRHRSHQALARLALGEDRNRMRKAGGNGRAPVISQGVIGYSPRQGQPQRSVFVLRSGWEETPLGPV